MYAHAHIEVHTCVCSHTTTVLENTTTEPHVHDISADIVRVWLSGYILQQTVIATLDLNSPALWP
jgi:hypothetical protein